MDLEKLKLTDEQIKAAKSVYRAMRKAAKLNVQFWDDYGTLSCYNGNTVDHLVCDDAPNYKDGVEIYENSIHYWEMLKNFHAGNADDHLYAIPRDGN